MRKVHFLIPQPEERIGGYLAEVATMEMVREHAPAGFVSYRRKVDGMAFLREMLPSASPGGDIFVVSWGHDVPKLVRQLEGQNIVYHAHSTGYGFDLPEDIPILAVSRNTLGYWGRRSPNSPLFYLPNTLPDIPQTLSQDRDIEVLVQTRKSSSYLMQSLVPLLRQRCGVLILDKWVKDLNAYFDRTRIFLYDSSEYWIGCGLTEGFGLPPLEAMARGCVVFSSLNDALADFLDPGFNCHQLRLFSVEYDVRRILGALENWKEPVSGRAGIEHFQRQAASHRMGIVLAAINGFFDARPALKGDIAKPFRKWKMPPLLALLPERLKKPVRKIRDRFSGRSGF